MEQREVADLAERLMAAVERRVPEYLANPADAGISGGESALCLIDASGRVWGRMFGRDKVRQRAFFRVAWTKASQVWITGIRTAEYERLVFTGQIDEDRFGIGRPDFIGWEGGQPLTVDGAIVLSAGFSGFRGTSDLEIVQKARAEVAKP